jgi:hypothetical protein
VNEASKRSWGWLLSVWSVCACTPARPAETRGAAALSAVPSTFEDEVAFLRQHGPVIVLAGDSGERVAVSPELQGRVMTSSVAPRAASLGWVNRAFIEAAQTGTRFDNYGGEDRFWLGPEGGQFGLYFPEGAAYTFSAWQTPPVLNEGAWTVSQRTDRSLVLGRSFHVKNHSGTSFDVAALRTVTLLTRIDMGAGLGVDIPPSVQVVGFETKNTITNLGPEPWTKARGLLSVWILGMYSPSADAHVVIPFDPAGPGEIVNDRYFGKVPPERLSVHAREGFLVFSCDGSLRSKIGVGPRRARSPLAAYSASAHLLTLVQYDHPANATDFVNSMWEDQKDPYAGDIVNSYNDGPTEPGKPSLGGFYELESSSPAAALAPGASLDHRHRTLHFVGERADLEVIARKALGIGLDDFSK